MRGSMYGSSKTNSFDIFFGIILALVIFIGVPSVAGIGLAMIWEYGQIDPPTGFHYKVKLRYTTWWVNEIPSFKDGMLCVKDATKRIGNSHARLIENKTECVSINKEMYYLEELKD